MTQAKMFAIIISTIILGICIIVFVPHKIIIALIMLVIAGSLLALVINLLWMWSGDLSKEWNKK